ncbi:MAG: metallopeptidase TldD-related protein [Elusimicrobiota bacterium]
MAILHILISIFLAQSAFSAPVGPAGTAPAELSKDPVLAVLETELGRTVKGLKNAEKVPLYYLGYELRDERTHDITASLGALNAENEQHYRSLDVDLRVGDRRFDNTHQIKGHESWSEGNGQRHFTEVSSEDDPDALRADIWLRTEDVYREAVDRYTKVSANKAVTAEEEDKSDDFSEEAPTSAVHAVQMPSLDAALWKERLKRLSAELKRYPFILDSDIYVGARAENRYYASSEGTRVVDGNVYVRLAYSLTGRTSDGMDLYRFKAYDAQDPSGLPPEERVLEDMRRSVSELESLLKAPITEPYTGPAILRARAAGVYFHEIMGHRLEGHRQKMEKEGQTFAKMLGQPVTAPFISVYDDPTLERLHGTDLRGHYLYDDEGMPARRVSLIEDGSLRSFLMSRLPIRAFQKSNGHGRRDAGYDVVPRMANLVVEAKERMPYARLRERLISEVKKQGKPYGMIFEDITGGNTGTGRSGPQSFKVIPLLVYRVYTDGRPDEVVRGVDIVGTPLTSFSRIIAAADDDGIFNGTCGAESGGVPVSAVSPSILFGEIEVEKKEKSSEKPPILPPPFHDRRQP